MTQDQTEHDALEVVNPATGEIIPDIRAADDETLARFVVDARSTVEEVGVSCDLISTEFLGRLDRALRWTRRAGDPRADVQYKITAPSPLAGTVVYPETRLEAVLRALVARGVIDEDGAARALKRRLKIELIVPLDADMRTIAARARELQIEIDGHRLEVDKADTSMSTVDAGIAALAKVEGTAAALERARERRGTPSRRVKIDVIQRER
jgi:hypothetical protein